MTEDFPQLFAPFRLAGRYAGEPDRHGAANGGIDDGPKAEAAPASGAANIVAVGGPIFAQPDWPYIMRSGAPCAWAPFDRKNVARPRLDYALAYPLAIENPRWTTAW